MEESYLHYLGVLGTQKRQVAQISIAIEPAAAIVPEGMDIEFVSDSTVRGRSEIHLDLVRHIDAQISIAVLGQTLTTQQGDSGSYALGAVHNLVRQDIEASDARQLAQTLRRDLVVPIVRLNHGPRRQYPSVLIRRESAADVGILAQALERLVPLGLPVRADEVRARLGLEAPAHDDETLAPPEPAPATALTQALARTNHANQDPIDLALTQTLDGWRPLMEPMVQPIRAAAEGGRTYEVELEEAQDLPSGGWV